MERILGIVSHFSNAGIGEFNLNLKKFHINKEVYTSKTVIANELVKERAELYSVNFPWTTMINQDITDPDTMYQMVNQAKINNPIILISTPPCQGSSALNATKGHNLDFRNQLVKSSLKFLKLYGKIEFGFIENVANYYNEKIPGIREFKNGKTHYFQDYIIEEKGNKLNYENFILTTKPILLEVNDPLFDKVDCYKMKKRNNSKFERDIYILASNTNIKDFFDNLNQKDATYISSIPILEFLKSSLNDLGYDSDYKVVKGEEFNSPQNRTRGFLVFWKKNLELKTKWKSDDDHNFTPLDAFKAMDLIREKDNVFKDTSHDFKKAEELFQVALEMEALAEKQRDGFLQNDWRDIFMHTSKPLGNRYQQWANNVEENSSAYFNKERICRPYKLEEYISTSGSVLSKRNDEFYLKEDSSQYFLEKGIVDFVHFVDQEIIDGEKDFFELNNNWMIKTKKFRVRIEKNMKIFITELLSEKPRFQNIESKLDLDEKTKFNLMLVFNQYSKEKKEKYFAFMSIKGYEKVTYKRGPKDSPWPALTTKMNFGNSNTLHPIFNRILTPAEVSSLFSLGIYPNENQDADVISENFKREYIIPLRTSKNLKQYINFAYEVFGEAVISSVSDEILENLIIQYLKKGI